jgi:hypothetical protein
MLMTGTRPASPALCLPAVGRGGEPRYLDNVLYSALRIPKSELRRANFFMDDAVLHYVYFLNILTTSPGPTSLP